MNSMPEVKRFFFESVLAGEYGERLSVNFIPGAPPELVLYGLNGDEISRESVGSLTFDQMHALVQEKGFKKVAQDDAAPQEPLEEDPPEMDHYEHINFMRDADSSDAVQEEEELIFPDGEEEAAAEDEELHRAGEAEL